MSDKMYISALLDVYGNYLSGKQKEYAEFYYNDDLSLSEISENEGISRQGVRDIIKRAEQRLTELEGLCGYCKRFSELRALSEKAKNGNTEAFEKIIKIIDEL